MYDFAGKIQEDNITILRVWVNEKGDSFYEDNVMAKFNCEFSIMFQQIEPLTDKQLKKYVGYWNKKVEKGNVIYLYKVLIIEVFWKR